MQKQDLRVWWQEPQMVPAVPGTAVAQGKVAAVSISDKKIRFIFRL